MLECLEQIAHLENNQYRADCKETYSLLSINFNKSHCSSLSGEKKPTPFLDSF